MDLSTFIWIPPLVSGLIAAGLAVFLWARRSLPGACPLMAMMLAVAEWSLAYAFEYSSPGLEAKFFWSRVEWLGVILTPTFWIVFAHNFLGRKKWLTRRRFYFLALPPILALLFIWVPPLQRFFWADIRLDSGGLLPLLVYRRGPMFWLFSLYGYGLLFWGVALLVRNFNRATRLRRRQMSILLVGLATPWLVNALYIFNLSPFKYLDLSPIALTVTGLALTFCLFRFQLLGLAPIAGKAVLESMPDGVFVFNLDDRLVGLNQAARGILGRRADKALGLTPDQVFLGNMELEEIHRALRDKSPEIVLAEGREKKYLELDSFPLSDHRDRPVGRLLFLRDVTVRRRTEEELREARSLYQVLAENVADLVAMCDPAARFIYVSPSYETVLGYREEELLGRPITALVHPDDLPVIAEMVRKKQERPDPSPIQAEYRLVDKAGRVAWFETKGRVLLDPLGKNVGATFITRDIDARKKAEEALRESQERFALLQEASFGGIGIHDKGVILDANDSLCRLTGYSIEELIGMNGLLLIAPAWRDVVLDKIVTGYDRPYDVEGIRKDQTTYPLEIQGRDIPYFERQARVTEFRDISERKRVERLFRESEAKYRTLFERANDAIIVFDLEERIIDINHKGCELLGRTREEVLSMKAADITAPDFINRRADLVNGQGLPSWVKSPHESVVRRDNGRLIPIEVSHTLVEGQDQGRVISILRDISERKRGEEEKSRLQAQLLQAQKMEAIGTLASGVAHDFNNILQMVGGYVQLLIGGDCLDERGLLYAREIDRASTRAAELVKGLLTFSRKVEPELKAVALNREIIAASKVLERTIPRMIAIEYHLDPDIPPVRVDVNQIHQVVMNLGANARDAMPDGGRLIFETRTQFIDKKGNFRKFDCDPGQYVLLRVSDTGVGMDGETLKHIFDPFFTTKEVGQGTGLGLSIVYGIVKSHGGEISCYSELGVGSSFNLYWPVAPEEKTDDAARIDPAFSPALEGRGESILLVDDEDAIVEIARESLTYYGYKVFSASSGEEALEFFRAPGNRADLVVLDLGMPGMGGPKCLEALLEIDPAARVLVASGYSDKGHVFRAAESGARDFLDKPYRLTDLLSKIRKILDE
ncbi:MAG: PAS domain S-box protein [Pseudomonadota bacterium]